MFYYCYYYDYYYYYYCCIMTIITNDNVYIVDREVAISHVGGAGWAS